MKAVVLAAGEGTRLRPLTSDKPKALVTVNDKPLLTHCFEELASLGAEEFVVVVGYERDAIRERYGNSYEGTPITYVTQEEQLGLAHALVQAEAYVDNDFMLMLGDNVFRGNLDAVVEAHDNSNVDAAFLVEEVPLDEARRYGICILNDDEEIVGIVEKPDQPPSNLALTGFYVFSPAVFHACHLVQPSDRGEYELSDAIDLLVESGREIHPVALSGWRIDVGYPEDRKEAERRLKQWSESRV